MRVSGRSERAPNQLSPEREEALIDAAREVFVEKGVGDASIDLIASRARVNKVTIYRRYKNKYALFETVIQRTSRETGAQLADMNLDPEHVEDSLREAALTIRGVYATENHREITRLMIAEANRHLKLCQRARAYMISILSQRLVCFFESLIARRQMESQYPTEAAISFVLLFSRGFRPLLFALRSEEEEERQFESDFAMFLKGNGISSYPLDG